MGRAINQRAAAEAYAQSKGYTPSQPTYWSLVAGVLTGHLAERDDEQAAMRPPKVADGEARCETVHLGTRYIIDYEFDDDASCAEVTHIWCGPHDLLPVFGDELAAAPAFAERAADADLKRCAGAIRRNSQRLETAMASGTDLPRFRDTGCSQCGRGFGPGDAGFSHCGQHAHMTRAAA